MLVAEPAGEETDERAGLKSGKAVYTTAQDRTPSLCKEVYERRRNTFLEGL